MLCAAGLIIISVQTREDVLQSDSFSPSSVCTKCWSSGAVCKSSAPPQSAAQLTTRDVKQSRRETRRCLRIKERNNRTTRWCKNPPKEAKRSKQSKTNKNKMKHNEYKQCFLWGAGSSTCWYWGAHCLIVCPHGYEPGLQGEPWHNMKMRLLKKHQRQSPYSCFTGFI